MENADEQLCERAETRREVTPVARFLSIMHWSPVALARACGVVERTAWRWKSGESAMPDHLVAWLEDLARYHNAHPAPEKPENTASRVFPVE